MSAGHHHRAWRRTLFVAALFASTVHCQWIGAFRDVTYEAQDASVDDASSTARDAAAPDVDAARLRVDPDTTTLIPRAKATFSANRSSVRWSVDEAAGGTVNVVDGRTVTYTAPDSEGIFHLRAADPYDPTVFAEAVITVRTASPQVIANVGEKVVAPTGHGTQTHLLHCAITGQWWLFINRDTSEKLETMYSSDFVTWFAGDSVALKRGHSSDGRDLSVAYRALGSHAIVHITQGNHSFGRYHIRATLTPGHIAFDEPRDINSGGELAPDGAATAILADGTVIDSTGWELTPSTPPLQNCRSGDVNVYEFAVKDDGTTTFGDAPYHESHLWCAGAPVTARQFLELGGTLFHFYADGSQSDSPLNILFNRRTDVWYPVESSSLNLPYAVFPHDATEHSLVDVNDWAATVAFGKVHAVRRVGSLGFEHVVLDEQGTRSSGAALYPQAMRKQSGLFLAPYRDGVVLVVIASDDVTSLVYTTWDGASTRWTPWATLSKEPADRSYISGVAPKDGSNPAIIWTQKHGSASPTYEIAAMLLP